MIALLLGGFLLACGVGLGAYLANHQYSQAEQNRSEQSTKQEERHEWFGFTGEDLTAFFTAGLFLATFALFCVTLIALRSQIRDTRILQRAFISVEPGGIRPFEGDDQRVACDVIIHNAGNLPARKVAWRIDRKFSVDGYERDFPVNPASLVGDIVVAPKAKARKGGEPTTKAIFREHLDNAAPDRAWLYIWGRVSYFDGFRDGRYTDFCHRYNLHGESGFVISKEKARYHEYGNRTDEG